MARTETLYNANTVSGVLTYTFLTSPESGDTLDAFSKIDIQAYVASGVTIKVQLTSDGGASWVTTGYWGLRTYHQAFTLDNGTLTGLNLGPGYGGYVMASIKNTGLPVPVILRSGDEGGATWNSCFFGMLLTEVVYNGFRIVCSSNPGVNPMRVTATRKDIFKVLRVVDFSSETASEYEILSGAGVTVDQLYGMQIITKDISGPALTATDKTLLRDKATGLYREGANDYMNGWWADGGENAAFYNYIRGHRDVGYTPTHSVKELNNLGFSGIHGGWGWDAANRWTFCYSGGGYSGVVDGVKSVLNAVPTVGKVFYIGECK